MFSVDMGTVLSAGAALPLLGGKWSVSSLSDPCFGGSVFLPSSS